MTLDTLGGYRLVRKLGQGERAELFLAHPESDAALTRPAAIKVFRPGVSEVSVIAEAEALSRAAGDHVVALCDLAMGPTGVPALILERLPGGSLARLLRDRSTLSAGEAITILAPLASTLSRLHGAGVVHRGLRLEAVSFDGTGAPVLACFGRAASIEPNLPPARLEEEVAVGEDLLAFERIASTVLERLALPARLPEMTASGWLGEVEHWLFGLGRPEPVRLAADEWSAAVPGRVVTGEPMGAEPGTQRFGRVAGFEVPAWLDVPGLVDKLGSLRASLLAVRTRVWAVAAAVAVALILAVAVVPGNAPVAVADQPVPLPTATAAGDDLGDAVGGDDPLLALQVLLETRVGCIRDLSVLCLDAVDQENSAALAHDQRLVREVRDGVALSVPIVVDAAALTIEERLGDAALVSLGDVADGEPASILLMKGEAGWRIRDYLEW